jgi:hypothetical protein
MKVTDVIKFFVRREKQRDDEERANAKQSKLSGLDRQLISRGQSFNRDADYNSLRQEKADMNILRNAKPEWQKDSLGVRGNPVEMMRQQAPLDIPKSNVIRRLDEIDVHNIVAGALPPPSPNPNADVPQPPSFVPPTSNDNPPSQPPPNPNTHLTHVDANYYVSVGWGYVCSDQITVLDVMGGTAGFDNGVGKSDGLTGTLGGLSVTWHQVNGTDFGPLYAQRISYEYQNNGDGTFRLVSADHF